MSVEHETRESGDDFCAREAPRVHAQSTKIVYTQDCWMSLLELMRSTGRKPGLDVARCQVSEATSRLHYQQSFILSLCLFQPAVLAQALHEYQFQLLLQLLSTSTPVSTPYPYGSSVTKRASRHQPTRCVLPRKNSDQPCQSSASRSIVVRIESADPVDPWLFAAFGIS